MKKPIFVFFVILTIFFAITAPSVVIAEETIYMKYEPETGVLTYDYVGTKLKRNGCHDVEGTQWDRLPLNAKKEPFIYLEPYGVGIAPKIIPCHQIFPSERIVFNGSIRLIPWRKIKFQIKFLTWVNDLIAWSYWPLGPGEPVMADFHGENVEVVPSMGSNGKITYVFQTTL